MAQGAARSIRRGAFSLTLTLTLITTLALPGTGDPPLIEYPPTPQATILGGRAIFTVIASGDPTLTYQWRKDASDLSDRAGVSGTSTDTLVLTGLDDADAADYSVVVSNAFGSATSAAAPLTVSVPRGGDVDFAFDPGSTIDRTINGDLAIQPDGKVLIGGSFTSVDGAVRGKIARLNTDGTTDHTFLNGLAGATSGVLSIVLQPDGRVLIGGNFITFNGTSRRGIARLNSDGSLDTTFLNGLAGVSGAVFSTALQPDGRVLIVGQFTSVNGASRNNVARLNADGSLDTTFLNGLSLTGANAPVFAIAEQPDGRVLIGGNFTAVNGVSRNRIARLNSDGSLDTTFLNGPSGANDVIRYVASQPDGRVLIAGRFTAVNSMSRNRIARLNSDGSLDTTFQNGLAGANDVVLSVAAQPDGRVLIAGEFTSVNGVSRNRLARLNADGNLDTTFLNDVAGANSSVESIDLQPDGRVLIGGEFTAVNEVNRNRIARLNSDGSLDTTFLNGLDGANNTVRSIALQPDGRVLIGGDFTTVDEMSRNRVARLNADGNLDTTFLNGLDGANETVRSIALQPDGRVLIGGEFTAVNEVSRNHIARLNADGSLDTSFLTGLAGANSWVLSIVVQPDGRLLIAGLFTQVNSVSRRCIARLNADGSLDTTFLNGLDGANQTVYSIALQPDGGVLIGGSFTTVNGTSRRCIARLNADGSLDTTFLEGLAGANGAVRSIVVQPDGRVLIGGDFDTVHGVSCNQIARLNADGSLDTTFLAGASSTVHSIVLQPDGRVLIGGQFSSVNGVSRNRIARLDADGSLDATFLEGLTGANSTVFSIALQPDRRVLLGGEFGGINGAASSFIARLHGEVPVAPAITTEPSSQTSYEGCCAVFQVEASGTSLDYRWRKDGVDLADGADVSGAASRTLTLTGVSAAEAGDYSVVVSNVLGSETSAVATLSVVALAQCRVASCDAQLGCVVSDLPNGTSCTEGNACTAADTCQAGSCTSGPCSCMTYPDTDGDGFGDAAGGVAHCDETVLPGHVTNDDDCDAASSEVYPGALEQCDALSNDCSAPDWPALVDLDRDVVEDACDNCAAMSNPGQVDADADSVGNPCDNCRHLANAGQENGDGDVHGDACDNCAPDDNDGQTDTDGDGIGDACEIDVDGDGVLDEDDSCPLHSNVAQTDSDADGVGDVCDSCPGVANTAQADADRDGAGDLCDLCTDSEGDGRGDPGFPGNTCPEDFCPYDALDDFDGDGVCGDADICHDDFDPQQEDFDGDGRGDACDNCADIHNPSQQNADAPEDDLGNECDPDMDGDGTPNAADFDQDGDGVPDDDGDGSHDPCPSFVQLSCDDSCPVIQNPMQADLDGDGVGSACDSFDDNEVGGALAARLVDGPNGRALLLSWEPEDGALGYNVYRALASELSAVDYGTCYRSSLPAPQTAILEDPSAGEAYAYLVTVVTADGEGPLGADSDGVERVNAHPCP